VAAGPAAALFMVSTSDLSGPIGTVKEAQAAGKALLDAASKAEPTSLLASAFGAGLTMDMASQVKALAPGKDKLIEIVKAGAAAVAAKSPGELQAYKNTILSVAQASAEAAEEGGFLGIGAKLVREMVLRDMSHPCIFAWANGDEGGANPNLDGGSPGRWPRPSSG
jgi:hypothetical protein